MDLPTFGGHPRRGALREVILEIITRKISRPGSRKWRREFLSKAFRKCFQMPRRVTHVPEHLSHLWTCTPGPPHFRWTPQTRGTSRSDGENSSSGKSRDPALASGSEGFFQGIWEMLPNAKICHLCARYGPCSAMPWSGAKTGTVQEQNQHLQFDWIFIVHTIYVCQESNSNENRAKLLPIEPSIKFPLKRRRPPLKMSELW